MKATILVVDDEELVRWSLRQRLEQAEYQVVEAGTGEAALEHYKNGVDLVLLDYGLPDTNGIDVLMTIRSIDPDPPVILLTAHSSVEKAVEAMQKGAYHYARKPFNLDDVAVLVEKALETTRLRREVRALQQRDRELHGFDKVVGESPEMRHVKALLRKIAISPASTVLLTGESGTGKDVAARAIHSQSDRSNGPFMNITCSALPETLLESELFGHERGAFTDAKTQKKGLLEQADGGTVFLDEIAEMSPTCRPSCCASSRRRPSAASAAAPTSSPTCASSRPRTATCSRTSATAASARTSTTAWPSSRCTCPRCASGRATSSCSRSTSSTASTASSTAACARSTGPR
jgi:two-component system, NtrC family, response regulator AtoC